MRSLEEHMWEAGGPQAPGGGTSPSVEVGSHCLTLFKIEHML